MADVQLAMADGMNELLIGFLRLPGCYRWDVGPVKLYLQWRPSRRRGRWRRLHVIVKLPWNRRRSSAIVVHRLQLLSLRLVNELPLTGDVTGARSRLAARRPALAETEACQNFWKPVRSGWRSW